MEERRKRMKSESNQGGYAGVSQLVGYNLR